jgi:hypothetical protein
MALPDPKPGLVINYSYLWRREADKGGEEGRKDRPCVIILAVEDIEGDKIVTVVPVTHQQPSDLSNGVELPHVTKKRLGLDDERSWVISTEVNRFTWPGSDLRPISRNKSDQFACGFVPADLVRKVVDQIRTRQRVAITQRDD